MINVQKFFQADSDSTKWKGVILQNCKTGTIQTYNEHKQAHMN